ncbi:MAG TPA: phosphoribosylglycinamide formyltransferase [Myxococcota bacterium]|nr:phosphoribosylglycinamide formyltransferase [Myxococcota bacterium]
MRLAVMVSGNGTNLQAILDACASGALDATVNAVFSNRQDAYAMERARRAGVVSQYVPYKPYRDAGIPRERYDADLADKVAATHPDVVVCAGWMHVLSAVFIDRFEGRVLNLHPALPGEYPGTDALTRAWEDARKGLRDHTGVMVHWVTPELDAGPVVAQERVAIAAGEEQQALALRMAEVEHRLLVGALVQIAAAWRGGGALPALRW